MNKKAFLPLILLIPLILIGLVVFYFILKAVIGLVIQAFVWTIAIAFLILFIFIIYLIIKFSLSYAKKR